MGRRIVNSAQVMEGGRKIRKSTGDETNYMDRLKNLIPAETAALYISGLAVIPTEQKVGLIVWASFCLVLTIIYMAWQTRRIEGKPRIRHDPDWTHVAISSFSFLLWVYTLGGPFTAFGIYIAWIGTLVTLAWTFMVPNFYKGHSS